MRKLITLVGAMSLILSNLGSHDVEYNIARGVQDNFDGVSGSDEKSGVRSLLLRNVAKLLWCQLVGCFFGGVSFGCLDDLHG